MMASIQTSRLSSIVHHVVQKSYDKLSELTDKLVHERDGEKKRKLLEYVEQTRAQFIRLFVLLQWSSKIKDVNQCWKMLQDLQQEEGYFRETSDTLYNIHQQLPDARSHNFDIPTAIDVFVNGTYERLPKNIKAILPPETPSGDKEETLLQEASHVVLTHLTASQVPKEFTNVGIENGQLHVTVENEFRASLTLFRDQSKLCWRLLHIDVLVVGASSDISFDIDENQLLHLLSMTQQQMNLADRPLVTLYDMLHSFCVSYAMEYLKLQAQAVVTRRWKGVMAVACGDKFLDVKYWSGAPSLNESPPPMNSGSDLPPLEDGCNCLRIYQDECSTPRVVHYPPLLDKGGSDISFDVFSENLESLLVNVMNLHATQKIECVYSLLLADPRLPLGEDNLKLCPQDNGRTTLTIDVIDSKKYTLRVENKTGHFILRQLESYDDEVDQQLSKLAESIKDKDSLVFAFSQLRAMSLVELLSGIGESAELQVWRQLQLEGIANPFSEQSVYIRLDMDSFLVIDAAKDTPRCCIIRPRLSQTQSDKQYVVTTVDMASIQFLSLEAPVEENGSNGVEVPSGKRQKVKGGWTWKARYPKQNVINGPFNSLTLVWTFSSSPTMPYPFERVSYYKQLLLATVSEGRAKLAAIKLGEQMVREAIDYTMFPAGAKTGSDKIWTETEFKMLVKLRREPLEISRTIVTCRDTGHWEVQVSVTHPLLDRIRSDRSPHCNDTPNFEVRGDSMIFKYDRVEEDSFKRFLKQFYDIGRVISSTSQLLSGKLPSRLSSFFRISKLWESGLAIEYGLPVEEGKKPPKVVIRSSKQTGSYSLQFSPNPHVLQPIWEETDYGSLVEFLQDLYISFHPLSCIESFLSPTPTLEHLVVPKDFAFVPMSRQSLQLCYRDNYAVNIQFRGDQTVQFEMDQSQICRKFEEIPHLGKLLEELATNPASGVVSPSTGVIRHDGFQAVLERLSRYLGSVYLFKEAEEAVKKYGVVPDVKPQRLQQNFKMPQKEKEIILFIYKYHILELNIIEQPKSQMPLEKNQVDYLCWFFRKKVAAPPFHVAQMQSFLEMCTLPPKILKELIAVIIEQKNFTPRVDGESVELLLVHQAKGSHDMVPAIKHTNASYLDITIRLSIKDDFSDIPLRYSYTPNQQGDLSVASGFAVDPQATSVILRAQRQLLEEKEKGLGVLEDTFRALLKNPTAISEIVNASIANSSATAPAPPPPVVRNTVVISP